MTPAMIKELSLEVPSIAARLDHHNTVIDLFCGRYLIWTRKGFRGISCLGVETCCDSDSVVMIVNGLSFPIIVRDYDEKAGEGLLAGCVLMQGVDMMGRDVGRATLLSDYERKKERTLKFK